jgi:hypothetical protein
VRLHFVEGGDGARPPPAPVVTAPPPKRLDAKTQLENHM